MKARAGDSFRRVALCGVLLSGCLLLCGCNFNWWWWWPGGGKSDPAPVGPSRIQGVRFADTVRPAAFQPPITLRGARNEVVHFALQINQFPELGGKKLNGLTISPFQQPGKADTIGPAALSAYQVLSMPVDANRAGFVRHTALDASVQQLPRALLPLAIEKGIVHLSSLRSAETPLSPGTHPRENDPAAPIVWIDVRIPPTVAPGAYEARCELVEAGKTTCSIPLKLAVDDLVLSDERHLLMAGSADWDDLARLFPRQFQGVLPHLLSRREPHHAGAVKVLDGLEKLAQSHRVQLAIGGLQPSVKWPSGKPPQIDWTDYDSVVAPWLKGEAFEDKLGVGYWPLPLVEKLGQFDTPSRLEYWQAAAAHFDAMDWLARSAVPLEKRVGGRSPLAASIDLCEEAAALLAMHSGIRVVLPLEEEQVHLATSEYPKRIARQDLARVRYLAAGLVSKPPLQRLPEAAGSRWLRTGDLPGLPYAGAGADEREVRMWAWLAFLRGAQVIQWPAALPAESKPQAPADPGGLVWFYPGSWFGIDQPVPTVQLKWLRRAEQDYEYLYLAKQRGQEKRAMQLARLITKPVEIQPAQSPDTAYTLLSGTSDPAAWEEVGELLSRTLRLAQPGQQIDRDADQQLTYDITRWSHTQERPLLMARSTDWGLGIIDAAGNSWLNLQLGLDIYNAAEPHPDVNRLQWASVPQAWSVKQEMTEVPKLGTYTVNRFPLDARILADKVGPESRQPIKLTFIDGYTNRPYHLQLMAPVAWTERRDGPPPAIDGSLGEWLAEDALHQGKLVLMYSRPAVQKQSLDYASTDSAIYSTWTPTTLYLGFKVDGVDSLLSNAETSFIRYEFRRAWGEDVCEVLIQPVYDDNSVGPLLHIACKPRGQIEISRRLNPKLNAVPWQAFAGSDIRYAANLNQTIWRGEMAIPWEALNAPGDAARKPVLLRFNFVQHQGKSGQSASWAGPIDFGREEAFTGLLEIRR